MCTLPKNLKVVTDFKWIKVILDGNPEPIFKVSKYKEGAREEVTEFLEAKFL